MLEENLLNFKELFVVLSLIISSSKLICKINLRVFSLLVESHGYTEYCGYLIGVKHIVKLSSV